jgi:RHS repeat-associated protein
VSDCTGQTTTCTAIDWPGYRTTAWHARSGDGPDIRTWFGGLVDDMRDASGQMYRRNRYYDPATGQFTQADPIGLAGGLNAYGFADGDPVSYSDPYGLSTEDCRKVECPKTTREVANNRQVRAYAEKLLRYSIADDGNEYGAHLVRGDNGSIQMVNVTRGDQWSIPRLPTAPDNAIAEIHTHPDEVRADWSVGTFDRPSGSDVRRANDAHVYGVIATPRKLLIVPLGQYGYTPYTWSPNTAGAANSPSPSRCTKVGGGSHSICP